jgi:hypothetical protein
MTRFTQPPGRTEGIVTTSEPRDGATPRPTEPGKPITAYDLALVRRTYSDPHSWPVPALLAEIDRLRRIEAAAGELVAFYDSWEFPPSVVRDRLRTALSQP